MRLRTLLAIALPFASGQVFEGASFGHKPEKHLYNIQAWNILGNDGFQPQVLSDKIILTPPYPGNKRGAVWTNTQLPYNEWKSEIEFRTTGPEHGSGNFQVWYTKEGQTHIGTNSMKTINKFEGLVIVADLHGNRGGMIRGFLNDGTTDFASHPHLDQLAFGHCIYSYRNRGRPSKITMQQDATGFEVRIDDGRCFRSDKILLPSNNYLGVTATSADTPDGHEIYKITTTAGGPQVAPGQQRQQQQQQQQIPRQAAPPPNQAPGGQLQGDAAKFVMPDILASTLKDQQAQFEDIHNRVQSIAHQVEIAIMEIQRTTTHLQLKIEDLEHLVARQQNVQNMESRLASLESSVNGLRNSQKDWTGHFNDIHASLKQRHDNLHDVLPDIVGGVITTHAPNMKLFIFLLLGFQAILAVAYVLYKRRLAQGPKKYL